MVWKPLALDRDFVGAQLQIAEQVSTAGIRVGLPRDPGIHVQRFHFGARNGGSNWDRSRFR